MSSSEQPLDPARARYVSLATRRRDGTEVRTPVWMAGEGGNFYLFTEARSGKVKRIRNDPAVGLAACTYNGRVVGPWRAGKARVVSEPATVARAYAALHRKYGWQMWLVDFFSKLSGRYQQRAIIEIELD